MKNTLNVQKHRSRPIRHLGLHDLGEWQVKLYGICSLAEAPAPEFSGIALRLARACLPPVSDTCYGLGFVTIHEAKVFNQIIVDWWEHDNELRHRVFKARPESPFEFHEITASGEAFCVWELAIICHERRAWLDAILSGSPDPSRYLVSTLHGDF